MNVFRACIFAGCKLDTIPNQPTCERHTLLEEEERLREVLTVYAVRNREGEWFRSVGYGGGGKSWVAKVQDAKLYTKLAQARSRVTYWANAYPEREPPVIVAFTMSLTDAKVLSEEDRVAAAKLKKATEKAENERREARRRLEEAERTIARANAEIESIRARASGG